MHCIRRSSTINRIIRVLIGGTASFLACWCAGRRSRGPQVLLHHMRAAQRLSAAGHTASRRLLPLLLRRGRPSIAAPTILSWAEGEGGGGLVII